MKDSNIKLVSLSKTPPKIHYKFSDHWEGEVGGNVFMGKNDYTFFGQFEDNTNIYLALKWSF